MSTAAQTKLDRLQAVDVTTNIYMCEAEACVTMQGETYNITVDDIDGTADVTLTPRVLSQLTNVQLQWIILTCRDLIAVKE
tara:strand:+ start:366 stop:608 length:243 start_codon:yes stop_codon:yes gene_type:complete